MNAFAGAAGLSVKACKAGLIGVFSLGLMAGSTAEAGGLSDPSFETVPDGEAVQIDETVSLGKTLQDKRARADETQAGRILRGVHAKSHGCVKATFTVNRDIETKYRVGLFSKPGATYDAWIRFSNAAVLRTDDLEADERGVRRNGSRGMAVKVMNVGGKVLNTDGGRKAQDFLMINTPRFAFANVRDYLRLNRILERSPKGDVAAPYFFPAVLEELGDPKEGEPTKTTFIRNSLRAAVANDSLLKNLTPADKRGTRSSRGVVKEIRRKLVRNPMMVQYFGAAPFLFGAGRAMKFSAAPCVSVDQKPFDNVTAEFPSRDYLREALGKTMSGKQDVCYDFLIQTRDVSEGQLNIEDATTTWPDELKNYVPAARIAVKVPQTPHKPEAIEICERLAFSPWHALADHRPLGGINRLRDKVYSESAKHRGAQGY